MTPEEFQGRMSGAANKLRNTSALMDRVGQSALARSKPRIPVDKGTLMASAGMRSDAKSATLYATAEHASPVHDGTSRMQARPFFTEGITDAIGEIEGILNDFGDEVLGAVG